MYYRDKMCPSLHKAKKMFNDFGIKGDWRTGGTVKCIVRGNCVAEWQSDTQVLVIDDLGDGDVSGSGELGQWARAPRPWLPIETKWGKGRSLPQLALLEPHLVIWEDYRPLGRAVAAQADEVLAKMDRVRIPRRYGKHTVVAHQHGRKDRYLGYQILPEADALRLPADSVGIEHWLEIGKYGPAYGRDEQQWGPSFFRAFVGDCCAWWDRQRCEAFFDDDANFIDERIRPSRWSRASRAARAVIRWPG